MAYLKLLSRNCVKESLEQMEEIWSKYVAKQTCSVIYIV